VVNSYFKELYVKRTEGKRLIERRGSLKDVAEIKQTFGKLGIAVGADDLVLNEKKDVILNKIKTAGGCHIENGAGKN